MNEIDKQYDAVCRQISSFDVELRTCASNREQLREKIYRQFILKLIYKICIFISWLIKNLHKVVTL